MAARPKIGMAIADLRMPGREAISEAARLGYQVIQIDTVGTEFEPRRFGQTARRDLRHFVAQANMEIVALHVDIGGGRLGDASRIDECVDRTRAAMEMAAGMRVPIVVMEPGPIVPDNAQVVEAMRRLAQSADRTGTILAMLTGQSGPGEMAGLIGELGAAPVRVCYDPAGLMLGGFDALGGIEPLASQIVLAYVRDAVPGSRGGSAGSRATQGHEVSLGEGHLDLADYIGALHEGGYFGPLIVRRLHAMDPVAELGKAREKLASLGR